MEIAVIILLALNIIAWSAVFWQARTLKRLWLLLDEAEACLEQAKELLREEQP